MSRDERRSRGMLTRVAGVVCGVAGVVSRVAGHPHGTQRAAPS
jgi:hypothetical protein